MTQLMAPVASKFNSKASDQGMLPPYSGDGSSPDMPEENIAISLADASEGAPSIASESSISPHYDDKRDIILHLECLSDDKTKRLTAAVQLLTLLGIAVLIAGIVLATTNPENYFFRTVTLYVANTTLAAMQVIALSVFAVYFAYRVIRSNRSKKRWSRRRFRGAQLSTAEISFQLTNSILFLVPNAQELAVRCTWLDASVQWLAFARWTMWNSLFLISVISAANMLPPRTKSGKYVTPERFDSMLLDGSLLVHWPRFALWCAMEGLLLAKTIVQVQHLPPQPEIPSGVDCTTVDYNCNYSTAAETLSYVCVLIPATYFVLYVSYTYRVIQRFKTLPYNAYRMDNLIVRLQIRSRGLAFTFFVATTLVAVVSGPNSCDSFIFTKYGMTPMQVVMTAVAIAWGYMTMPKRPEKILQVWLQEFAWTENDIERKRRERSSSLPEDSFEGFCIDCEPLFCFETALKLMYWSFLAYERGEIAGSPFKSKTALDLFGLRHFELVWERKGDTKAVIGWNDDTVVIAFRGTSSMANALTDLQVWRTRYPPEAPISLFNTPMVHRGFLKAYTSHGFNKRLLGTVESILNRCQVERLEEGRAGGGGEADIIDRPPVRVYVTGHSLGGALATLCAFDIASGGPCAEMDVDVQCITWGAPRVGNRAWAQQFNKRVTDCWQIINSDDAVTRAGKFFKLYKHVGHRVLINRQGLLLVRPSWVEFSMRRLPGGSVKDHLLTAYQRAMSAIVAAQFGKKNAQELSMPEEEVMQTSVDQSGFSQADIPRASLDADPLPLSSLPAFTHALTSTVVPKSSLLRRLRCALGLQRRPDTGKLEVAPIDAGVPSPKSDKDVQRDVAGLPLTSRRASKDRGKQESAAAIDAMRHALQGVDVDEEQQQQRVLDDGGGGGDLPGEVRGAEGDAASAEAAKVAMDARQRAECSLMQCQQACRLVNSLHKRGRSWAVPASLMSDVEDQEEKNGRVQVERVRTR